MKTKSIDFKDFMKGKYKNKEENSYKKLKKFAGAAGGFVLASTPAATFASGNTVQASADVTSKIVHAFDPLIHMISAISVPVAGVILSGAAIMVMVNQKEKGYSMIFNACIGYVLVQMVPLFISLLASIGGSIAFIMI